MQNVHKEDKSLSLSMPVITEEEEENESSETGTDEISSNYWGKVLLVEHQGLEPLKSMMVDYTWWLVWHTGEF